MLGLIAQYGIVIVAVLVLIGETGIPTGIPIEVALLLAGAYAIHSWPALLAMIVLVALADVAGTTALHLVARTGGYRLLTRLVERQGHNGEAVMERWRRRLGGHDTVVVFVVRLLPLVRMYISIGTGLLRIRFRQFLLGAVPAAFIWAGTPLALGYLFRAQLHDLTDRYAAASQIVLVAVSVASACLPLVWWIRRGPTRWMRVQRFRVVLGCLAALAALVFLARLIWTNERASELGRAALPLRALAVWLGLLGIMALALLTTAWGDLRQIRRTAAWIATSERVVTGKVATAIGWVVLVLGTVVIVTLLELHYPVF